MNIKSLELSRASSICLNVGYELKNLLKKFQALYKRLLLDILSSHFLLLRDSYNGRDIKVVFNIALGMQNCFY